MSISTIGRRLALALALALAASGAASLRAQGPRPQFVPIQPELFAAGGALANAFADIDQDGDLDLFVGFNGTPNRLYVNNGGTFRDIAAEAGVADARATRAAAWSDVDADGDPDLLLGFTPGAGPVLRLYRNDGAHFTDITAASGLTVETGAVRQPAFIDVDGDGDLDLFVAFRDRANMLYRNSGGVFTDVAASVGLADIRKSVGAVWFDYQQDGDLDLYVANQDGDANGFFRNDAGTFTDIAETVGLAWGGRGEKVATQGTVRPCVADVNNDGVADIFSANYGPNGLFLGSANGTFRDVSAAWGVAIDGRYDTCAFADVDHDGLLDLYVNGTVSATESFRDYLFVRVATTKATAYVDITPANLLALTASHGVQWADVDGDGALDLALAGSRPEASHPVLRTVLPAAVARRSLQVRAVDANGRATLAGAEVRVYAAGTRALLATRWVDAGSGYDAQSDMPVHIGLTSMKPVDVEVTALVRGSRVATTVRRVSPAAYAKRALVVRVTTPRSGAAASGPRAPGRIPVVIETTRGTITALVDSARAPISATNFLRHVDSLAYDGGRFHRAVTMQNQPSDTVRIEVIQGGPNASRLGARFAPIPLERTRDTGLRHRDGTLSMARGGPESATSDFFICIGDQPALDFGGHRNLDGQGFAAFGEVTSGMDVVRAIQRSPVTAQALSPPVRIVRIRRATVSLVPATEPVRPARQL
ncbi:FG-GAP-like repeat-containing protein [Gemmatimonas sp.]|uniref:FG-GAP-like repeat-containing protein n=1 Tax=Gemmatimonas sp. TaxID=1962908 RepID=UPI00286A7028|nr:FG-GAP-like repeat-containing protein [Gemmatimonas sp.]